MEPFILVIDKDIRKSLEIQSFWLNYGISTVRVDTIQEAIDIQHSKLFLFVAVNADTIDYNPLLKMMREIIRLPIFIVTSNFLISDQIRALLNGADAYVSFQKTTKDDIESALAFLNRYKDWNNQDKRPVRYIMQDHLIIYPECRKVFNHDTEIALTKKEFDVLLLLMNRQRYVFSPEQIYRQVWEMCYDENSKIVIWTLIKRLRRKLQMHDNSFNYLWASGYRRKKEAALFVR